LQVKDLRAVAAGARKLESDFEELMRMRQADVGELQRLRAQSKDYGLLLEENAVLRQQLSVMHERELHHSTRMRRSGREDEAEAPLDRAAEGEV